MGNVISMEEFVLARMATQIAEEAEYETIVIPSDPEILKKNKRKLIRYIRGMDPQDEGGAIFLILHEWFEDQTDG